MAVQTYRVPKRYLNLNAAEMLFFDAIYYLFEQHGWTAADGSRRMETNRPQLERLSGIAERTLNKPINSLYEQPAPYTIYDEGVGRGYILVLADYEQTLVRGVVSKPIALVENEWLRVAFGKTKSRFPLAILNSFLARPHGKRRMRLGEIRARCKHPERAKIPPTSKVVDGLATLVDLQLVRWVDDDLYELVFETFFLHPQQVMGQRDEAEPEIVETVRELDPLRVTRMYQLTTAGSLRVSQFADEMLRDLRYVGTEEEFQILLGSVGRKRVPSNDPARWGEMWAAYCDARARKVVRVESEKRHVSLAQGGLQRMELMLDAPKRLRYIKLVIWLDDALGLLHYHKGVTVRVVDDDIIVREKVLSGEDGLERWDLSAAEVTDGVWVEVEGEAVRSVGLDFLLEGEYFR